MFPPTLEEAILTSEHIVIAKYIGYNKLKFITYFNGPVAKYKVIKNLKGNLSFEAISIRYMFNDGSACLAPKNWRFNDGMMPKPASTWVLFLKRDTQHKGLWMTYRGDFGRKSFSENFEKEINKKIKK